MSKVIYLDEARQHTLSAGATNMIRLTPGRNVIDDDDYEAVLNSRDKSKPNAKSRLEEMIDAGTIRVVGDTIDIRKMTAKDALELVELEVTEDGLMDLHDQESNGKSRPTILKAIESKMDSIDEASKAAAEGDNEGTE